MGSHILGLEGGEKVSDDPGEIVTAIDPLVEVHEVTDS